MEARGWSLVLSDGLGQFLDPFLETASVTDRAMPPTFASEGITGMIYV